MKKRLLPFIYLLIFAIAHPIYSQIFVKHDASGANNGTSWADAYTDLKVALDAATMGDEIWVATGTYKPDGMNGDPASTFLINQNLQLLGGFNGNETSADQRDPEANVTVLSGDLNGDDVDDNFVNFKSDNVMTVVTINANITNETLIDGFTIHGGHADGTGGFATPDENGGAIYSNGSPTIRHCTFLHNYAFAGGGAIIHPPGVGQATIINKCIFVKNTATFGGAVAFPWADFYINGCTFEKNSTFDGTPSQDPDGGAVAVYVNQDNNGGTIQDCVFQENTSVGFGGGIYGFSTNNSNGALFEIKDCVFEKNMSVESGGGTFLTLRGTQPSATVSDCDFNENNSGDGGSALMGYLHGQGVQFEMKNSQFTGNTANDEGTVNLWGSFGGTGTALVDNCLFQNNTAAFAGGLQFGNTLNGGATIGYVLTNSTFVDNEALEDGAVEFGCRNNSVANILVEDCVMTGNRGTVKGGAVGFLPGCENFNVTLNRCKITKNVSPSRGAVNSYLWTSDATFQENAAIQIINSLIAENDSEDVVIGLEDTPNFTLINCTVANNSSNGIELINQSGLILQNTIFHNPGHTEYVAATEDVTVTSLGGNLIADTSFAAHALTYDHQEVADPGFVGGGYHLHNTSPAIDKGVDLGNLPATDLDGNDRRYMGGCVDIGAYESQIIVSSNCLTDSKEALVVGMLVLSPNPAFDFVNINFPETITSQMEASLLDAQGKLVRSFPFIGQQMFGLQGLVPGMYLIKIVAKEKVYIGKFIKQ